MSDTMTDTLKDNVEIIRTFIAAWSRLDAKELADYFTDDGCYYNMPTQPVRGRAQVEEFIRGFTASWTATEWDLLNIAAAGDVVFTERLDRTRTQKGNVDLPCAGVFVMQNGKIREWRDYFDLGTFMRALQS